ncbi:MAG TPA: adenylate/guanylate cyclase domain-containing protein [Candidatus Limnocylindrales bacterium]|nr:adenylate/guanylate cyclase domain-containing protein [Candidatus Limnocylindrales bacterium]
MAVPAIRSWRRRLSDRGLRLVAIADDPADDDDLRRRKRAGLAAGLLTILAPLTLPLQLPGQPSAWVIGISLSAFSLANVVVLATTGVFERFVVALVVAGAVFVPLADFLGGGITGPSTGLVWAFLVPGYAILALGPRRAARWFVLYLALVALMVVVDPVARARAGPSPYPLTLFGQVQNTVLPLAITFLLLRYTDIRRLAAEARVDELLTNAIPAVIATRLRRGERRIADAYPATTILFADIVGFTPWAQRTPPDRVVAVLDDIFSTFDQLTEASGLEKIRTIGDGYMAVAGAPVPRDDHAVAALTLARAMVASMAEHRLRLNIDLQIRLGLASGPVVGGVIGERRILFDLWGDAVNLASRMESSGVAGRIQISAATRSLLGDSLDCVAREVDVKGFGRQTTYLVG